MGHNDAVYRTITDNICLRCGACVGDRNLHNRWHIELPAAQPADRCLACDSDDPAAIGVRGWAYAGQPPYVLTECTDSWHDKPTEGEHGTAGTEDACLCGCEASFQCGKPGCIHEGGGGL